LGIGHGAAIIRRAREWVHVALDAHGARLIHGLDHAGSNLRFLRIGSNRAKEQ
jgi:hypothetical protein